MTLSSLFGGSTEYIEFGWVTAPNAAGQSISANTITTLTLDTEVADTGNLVSAPTSNQFTLPAGTYYYEAYTKCRGSIANNATLLSLYNVSDSQYVSRSSQASTSARDSNGVSCLLNGQFAITASKTFDLRLLSLAASTVDSAAVTTLFTNSTAGADQRTTIKLWKLK